MIQSVRDDVFRLIGGRGVLGQGHNLSLYFGRLCKQIDEPEIKEHAAKDAAIGRLEAGVPQEAFRIYRRAFREWRRAWEEAPDALCFELECRTPLIVGFGDQNVHEFGVSLQRPWGTPFIPGSALKGIASAFAGKEGGEDWRRGGSGSGDGRFAAALFGGTDENGNRCAGGVGFADAWWVPDSMRPFRKDIVNVHYRNYYGSQNAETWPDGTEPPLPVQFAAIRPGTRFLVSLIGPPELARAAKKILVAAGDAMGFGGKTRSGYGRMRYLETPEELCDRLGTMADDELAALFKSKGGDSDFEKLFLRAVGARPCTPELHDLFKKFRPAALLLHRLRTEKPGNLKAAGNIRKEFSSTIPASTVDPTDPDVQAIFDLCRSLALPAARIEDTWLAAFAYGFDHMARGKNFEETQEILLDHLAALESRKTDWPDVPRVRKDLEKLDHLSREEREELRKALELLG